MRILFLTHHKPDWILDSLYQGFVENGHEVIDYPPKNYYRFPLAPAAVAVDHHAMIKSAYGNPVYGEQQIKELLATGQIDLVVATSRSFGLKNRILSDVIKKLKFSLPSKRDEVGWRWGDRLGLPASVPLVVVDSRDASDLDENNLPLLERCLLYFKREIPRDTGEMFHYFSPHNHGSACKNAHKIRQIPIGMNLSRFERLYPDKPEKCYDVAFLMNPGNHPLRQGVYDILTGMKTSHAIYLSGGGARTGLSIGDYLNIIKSSRIALSISGLGWDCIRHYEIPACSTVLMANEPTILREKFFRYGESAILFKNDLSDFREKLEFFLGDHAALDRMARNGRDLLERCFDVHRSVEYILDEVQSARLK